MRKLEWNKHKISIVFTSQKLMHSNKKYAYVTILVKRNTLTNIESDSIISVLRHLKILSDFNEKKKKRIMCVTNEELLSSS